jgi:hypothetical protein
VSTRTVSYDNLYRPSNINAIPTDKFGSESYTFDLQDRRTGATLNGVSLSYTYSAQC